MLGYVGLLGFFVLIALLVRSISLNRDVGETSE